jgi:hypothetical protein
MTHHFSFRTFIRLAHLDEKNDRPINSSALQRVLSAQDSEPVFSGAYASAARFVFVQHTKTETNIQHEPKLYKIYQMVVNIPKEHKIYLHFPCQGLPKFAQNWDFGLIINHLAILTYIRKASVSNADLIQSSSIGDTTCM